MSSTPPAGYGYWAATVQTTGATHLSVVTCGFQNATFLTASQCNSLLRSSMGVTNSPWLAANIQAGFVVLNTYVLINTGAGLYSDINSTVITGTAAGATAPPLNTALVIKKVTLLAGRQFRGRFMVPPFGINESDVSIAGQITGTSFSNASSRWANFYNSLVINNMNPVILHAPPKTGSTPAPTAIIAFTPTPLIGSIKRRIRS